LQEASTLPKVIQHHNTQQSSCDVMCFVDATTTPDGGQYTLQQSSCDVMCFVDAATTPDGGQYTLQPRIA
jgi:hypothetical protein